MGWFVGAVDIIFVSFVFVSVILRTRALYAFSFRMGSRVYQCAKSSIP